MLTDGKIMSRTSSHIGWSPTGFANGLERPSDLDPGFSVVYSVSSILEGLSVRVDELDTDIAGSNYLIRESMCFANSLFVIMSE